MKKEKEIVIEGSIDACQDIDEVINDIKQQLMKALAEDSLDGEDLLFIAQSAMRHVAAAKYAWVHQLDKPAKEFDDNLKEYAKEADKLLCYDIHKASKVVRKWHREERDYAEDYDED